VHGDRAAQSKLTPGFFEAPEATVRIHRALAAAAVEAWRKLVCGGSPGHAACRGQRAGGCTGVQRGRRGQHGSRRRWRRWRRRRRRQRRRGWSGIGRNPRRRAEPRVGVRTVAGCVAVHGDRPALGVCTNGAVPRARCGVCTEDKEGRKTSDVRERRAGTQGEDEYRL
jgi:hypothetical protein